MEESIAEEDAKAARDVAAVHQRRADIEKQRRNMLLQLVAAAFALALLLGGMGVLITHRVVGPVHKMKRLLRQVGTGKLVVKERLRRGDELYDLFDTFLQMTYSLKALQSGRLATLDATIREAEKTGASPDVLSGMRALRAQMVLGLTRSGRKSSAPPPPGMVE
jgi:nitrogen fixation/metabolism regulation signal transduction histidine kinase